MTATRAAPAEEPPPQLHRAMGFRDLLLFYLVTGFTVRWIGTAAAAGPSAVVIWLIACRAFYVPLMFTVLELSSRYPNEGGCYVWSKRAFGDFAGFITGSGLFLIGIGLVAWTVSARRRPSRPSPWCRAPVSRTSSSGPPLHSH